MRNLQSFALVRPGPVEDYVQVDRPRAEPDAALLPAEFLLHALEAIEQEHRVMIERVKAETKQKALIDSWVVPFEALTLKRLIGEGAFGACCGCASLPPSTLHALR